MNVLTRTTVAQLAMSVVAGFVLLQRMPFPANHPILALIAMERPAWHGTVKTGYIAMLFTTPFIGLSVLTSFVYVFIAGTRRRAAEASLPRYPSISDRRNLFLVLGEVHHPRRTEPAVNPHWLILPDRGLFTGIAIFGAIGSGKTSGCMYPFAEQLFGYRAAEQDRKVGGLVLEVKGDFCHKVRAILEKYGRGYDYVEIGLDCPYRYNPLHNDLDAYALAYGIASLLNNLFGRGKEPFWQQAYTNLVKFIILLHKVLYDYVTLFDVYEGAINPAGLEQKIQEGERLLQADLVLVEVEEFMQRRDLDQFPFELDTERHRMKAPATVELRRYLTDRQVAFELVQSSDGEAAWSADKIEQFEAVKRWYKHDWCRIEPKLRTSIVEGISVFLSLFDDNPAVKRVFCPPKATYDPVKNADGRYGIPLPPFSDLIESGAVCALNFPMSTNPGLAKAIGTMIKQDYQRAVINRIPAMERRKQHHFRETVFMCDEYHSFATVGESDPSGDEKFFALSRQAKCIPIVATQSISSLRSTLPGESWRTLLQTFRTKIFLSLSDDFSARTASELCGKEEQLKLHYSFSENGQDAGVNMLSGQAAAHRSSVGTSKGYNVQRDFVFEPKIFAELKNAQAIVLAYDGRDPHPPSYCYLKPYFLNLNQSYFQHLAAGRI